MNGDFVFKMPGGNMVNLTQLRKESDRNLARKLGRDMRALDANVIEVFSRNGRAGKNSPPLNKIGRMSAHAILSKFE